MRHRGLPGPPAASLPADGSRRRPARPQALRASSPGHRAADPAPREPGTASRSRDAERRRPAAWAARPNRTARPAARPAGRPRRRRGDSGAAEDQPPPRSVRVAWTSGMGERKRPAARALPRPAAPPAARGTQQPGADRVRRFLFGGWPWSRGRASTATAAAASTPGPGSDPADSDGGRGEKPASQEDSRKAWDQMTRVTNRPQRLPVESRVHPPDGSAS